MPAACLQRRPQRLRREEGPLRLQLFFRRLRAAYPQGAGRIRMAAQLPTAARELCEAFLKHCGLPSEFVRRRALFRPSRRCHPLPAPVADAAKAQGIIIYAIGLVGSDGVDVSALNEWATDPDAAHVAVTPDAADLEQLFADLAANISNPGATDIVIDEVVNPDFVITSVLMPSKGSAAVTGLNSLRWTIPELGVTASESAVLEFFIRHTAQTSGVKEVNQSIDYSDAEGNAVTFPDPTVTVSCDVVVCPEGCPDPVDLSVEGCADAVVVDAGDVYLESQGRTIQLNVTLKNVCPGKRVALAAILTEVDDSGQEYSRGLKTLTIPAHDFPSCRDVHVRCIKFVVPEDLNVSSGAAMGMCSRRSFRARFIAHTIDTSFRCCQGC